MSTIQRQKLNQVLAPLSIDLILFRFNHLAIRLQVILFTLANFVVEGIISVDVQNEFLGGRGFLGFDAALVKNLALDRLCGRESVVRVHQQKRLQERNQIRARFRKSLLEISLRSLFVQIHCVVNHVLVCDEREVIWLLGPQSHQN